jgi:hypothetical protein
MYVSFEKNIRYIGKVIHISHHLYTLLLRIRLIMTKMLLDLSTGDSIDHPQYEEKDRFKTII